MFSERQLRTFERYALCVPAKFSWSDERGLVQQGCGSTRDISAQGVFIQARTAPLSGSVVTLEVALPSGLAEFPAVTIKAQGQVVRVEHPNDGKELRGFAVRNESILLQAEEPVVETNDCEVQVLGPTP